MEEIPQLQGTAKAQHSVNFWFESGFVYEKDRKGKGNIFMNT